MDMMFWLDVFLAWIQNSVKSFITIGPVLSNTSTCSLSLERSHKSGYTVTHSQKFYNHGAWSLKDK